MRRDEAEHLVRRTGFGVDQVLVEALLPLGRSAAVDVVTDFSPNPPADAPAGIFDEQQTRWAQTKRLGAWWMERMRTVPRPLEEKLVLYWHGHFATNVDTHKYGWQAWEAHRVMRAGCMGNFGDLARQVSLSSAMLLYLDNYRNKAGRPNENFARELFELHLLGPGGHYTEADVTESARAWTGHHLDAEHRNYRFQPTQHDNGFKTIFGVTRNWDGPEVIGEAVAGRRREASARYVVARLWSFFGYPDPEPSLVEELAAAYSDANQDLAVLVRAILNRPEFYSDRARGALVRSPVEVTAALTKGGGISADESQVYRWAATMGQDLFRPPDPSGWSSQAAWISTVGTWMRADFARQLAWRIFDGGTMAAVHQMGPDAAVDLLADRFSLGVPSSQTRRAMEDCWRQGAQAHDFHRFRNAVVLTALSPEMQLG